MKKLLLRYTAELKEDYRQTVDGALADYQMALIAAYGTCRPGWFKKALFERRVCAGNSAATGAHANVVLAFNNAIGVFDKPENHSAAHEEIAKRPSLSEIRWIYLHAATRTS